MGKYDKYIGTLFDEIYEIKKIIGLGGMAVVFEAYDNANSRTVAIKMLREEFNDKKDYVKRFAEEAKTLSKLNNPGIVRVYKVNTKSTPKYMVMEKVEGVTLRKYMDKKGALSLPFTISIAKQILEAVEYANSSGVIHRDIKPHNIMLKKDGKIVLTDFGIASNIGEERSIEQDSAIGTAYYLSPEQAEGVGVDCTTDVYSIGIVLYEMITGQLPFKGETAEETALMHINQKPVPPGAIIPTLPSGFEQIILHAIEKKTENRFSNCAEMLLAIQRFEEDPFIVFKFKKTKQRSLISQENSSISQASSDQPKPKKRKAKEDSYSITPSILGVFCSFVFVALVTAIYVLITIFPNSILNVFDIEKVPDVTIEDYMYTTYNDRLYYELIEDGYDIEIEYVMSKEFPPNTIISQSPVAGRVLKETNLSIKFTVTQEVAKVTVPDLTMTDYRTAKNKLEILGFKVKIIDEKSDSIDIGTVIKMNPSVGSNVESGSTISLYVSSGNKIEYIEVPDFVSKYENAIVYQVKSLFKIENVTYEYSDKHPAGTVISQSIGKGMYVPKGSFISFTISLGNDPNIIPTPTPDQTPTQPSITTNPSI